MRILIVDDSRTARFVLRKLLKVLGHTDVSEAADGHQGLSAVQDKDFDLILCDWRMPHMNGLEFVRALRRTGARDVPVVMVTSESEAQRIVEAMKAGAFAYLQKPFTAEALRAKLREVTKRRELTESTKETTLSGSLDEIGFPELLQFVNAASLTGELRLQASSGEGAGTVTFHKGEIWDARCPGGDGLGAFQRLSCLADARFRFVQRRQTGPRMIPTPTVDLLTELIRRRDGVAARRAG